MKLRSKIIVIFLLSIIISVVIFLFTNVYLVNKGWWAGIKTSDMENAIKVSASKVEILDAFEVSKIQQIFIGCKGEYPGMEFELYTNQFDLIYSTAGNQQIRSLKDLLNGLSKHGEYSQKKWLAACELELKNGKKAILSVIVPSKYFTALNIGINGEKGAGIFGKMFFIGLGITLIISSLFAYIFSLGMSRRFNLLYKAISKLHYDNLEITLNDNSRDEIGYLSGAFNKMAERLKSQLNKEKKYTEERKKLVSNISHDIRTPLTSIIGYSESLENGVYENEEEREKYIGIIKKKALYMDKLLGTLLDFSRMESGNFKIHVQKVNVPEMLREIIIEYLPVLQENSMEINIDFPDMPAWADIDRDQISRVLRNLLDNAVKYGKEGVYLDLSLSESMDKLFIKLKDYGPGIDEKNIGLIFERFFREDKARNTKMGGIGLGLSIADDIVKLHGGSINVVSTKGKGTEFTIALPRS